MTREAAFIGIIAFGMTFVLVGAGIDISVGSVLGLSGVVTAICLTSGVPILPSVVAGTLVGLASGLITGSAVVGFRIPSLIASLGMLYSVRGLSLLLSGGQPIVGFPKEFSFLGSGKVFGVPVPIILFVFLGVVAHFALTTRSTGTGSRHWAAIGSPRGSRASHPATRAVDLRPERNAGGIRRRARPVEIVGGLHADRPHLGAAGHRGGDHRRHQPGSAGPGQSSVRSSAPSSSG